MGGQGGKSKGRGKVSPCQERKLPSFLDKKEMATTFKKKLVLLVNLLQN